MYLAKRSFKFRFIIGMNGTGSNGAIFSKDFERLHFQDYQEVPSKVPEQF